MHRFLIFTFLVLNCKVLHSSLNKKKSFENENFLGEKSKHTLNDIIPSFRNYFEVNDCLETIILNDVELHLSYLYWASNNVLAANNYRINPGMDIRMKAEKTIVLKPNATVLKGSKYLARIENCENLCNESILFPKFFTQNGDGYNDFWKIPNLEELNSAKIMIFDRFGKLLKNLSTNEIGWDGFYTSSALPSNDYWFILTDVDCNGKLKKVKSHFTLKR